MEKVRYIMHSGFLLELDKCYMLFDYYKGEIPALSPEKELLVFASHNHHDHFNPEIFKLAEIYPKVTYILSSDIPKKNVPVPALFVEENKEYTLGVDSEMLKIQTLHSTDQGVAFLLEIQGKKYYHAGDLNLWIWEGESDAYNEQMKKDYYKELDKLKDMEMEIAFVPLDPRQEKDAFLGLESFLETAKAKKVYPMHFWEKPEIIQEFLNMEGHEKYRHKVQSVF